MKILKQNIDLYINESFNVFKTLAPNRTTLSQAVNYVKYMINLNLKIGHGRSMEVRQEVAEKVFAIFCEWMKPITDNSYCQISFELTELDPVLKFNKNNIHGLFK